MEKESNFRIFLTLLAFGLIIFGARLHVIDTFAVPMPYWDDWGLGGFVYEYKTGELDLDRFLQPSNEHLMSFTRLMNLWIFNQNHEQWDPMVGMFVNAVIWTVTGLILLWVFIRHQSRLNIYLLASATLVIWAFPIALVNNVWGIQSHNYLMIFFAVLGCWLITRPPLSIRWGLGLFCLVSACFTLAGGAMLPVAVACVYGVLAYTQPTHRRDLLTTAFAVAVVAVIGLLVVLSSQTRGVGGRELDLWASFSTFSKALSFPLSSSRLPAFLFILPILVLALPILRGQRQDDPFHRFLLCLYGFVFLVALVMGYSRASDGDGPTRRYAEFLSLAWVASTAALLMIVRNRENLPGILVQILTCGWLLVVVFAVPKQFEIFEYTRDLRDGTRPHQEENVRKFLNTRDASWLDQPFLHIPFHNGEYLKKILEDFQAADILSYHLQIPPRLNRAQNISLLDYQASAFVRNGTFNGSESKFGFDYGGESVWGSYKPDQGGVLATGKFTSEPFELTRPYSAILVTGYFGFAGTSLKLINEHTGDEIDVGDFIGLVDSKYADVWREVRFRTPRGIYRIVAEDTNDQLWFGFTTPRSVGRLSHQVRLLFPLGHSIWLAGLCLLLFTQRRALVRIFAAQVAK